VSRKLPQGTRLLLNLLGLTGFVVAATWFAAPLPSTPEAEDRVELAPPATAAPARDGIAAVVLMDVSGSMGDPVDSGGSQEAKIDVARRAALALIRQFDDYRRAHPDEPVLVGLTEFSDLDRGPNAREVIPLAAPDLARAQMALDGMRAAGGTPIGDAMIAGKRALDAANLSRRHLLVVTDGENTDGPSPSDFMASLARRPDAERPSVYFVAFDVDARRFARVREAGALVLSASNAAELNGTLDTLLTGRILVEEP
jgi:Mg-chelatase subunit ChlD